MPKLSTAKRIIFGFAIAPLALLTVVFYALNGIATLKDQTVAIVDKDWPKIDPILTISNNIRDNGKNTRDLLFIDEGKEDIYKAIENTRDSTGRALSVLVPLFTTPKELENLRALQQSRERYVKAFMSIMALIKKNDRDAALEAIRKELVSSEQGVFASLNTIMEAQKEEFEQRKKTATLLYTNAIRNLMILLVICLLLVGVAGYFVVRSVIKPLGGEPDVAAAALREIAQGNLGVEVTVRSGDSDSVMFNLQKMKENLSVLVRQIASAVEHVASSSKELNTVSRQTSEHLQLQSSELEQAATAVNEMTAAVDEVARNAVSTAEASEQSELAAKKGKEQVQETVDAIGQLSKGVLDTSGRIQQLAGRVQNISKVLDVIRGIAEQTNLLALNAAIEAARAGDAGRGFAVVADEVRALAHRTQESTKEIEEMIANIRLETGYVVDAMSGSSTLVVSVLDVARRAGQALEEITLSVSAINERNLVIASATEEQALVAREVDRNLMGIKSSSEKVLSGAQRTNEEGQELARMADALHITVSQFHT